MRRRLFNVLSAVSLLLCVAVCLLWVRSYATYDGVYHRVTDSHDPLDQFRAYCLESARGRCFAVAYVVPKFAGTYRREGMARLRRAALDRRWQWARGPLPVAPRGLVTEGAFTGQFGATLRPNNPLQLVGVCVPHWFIALLTMALPAWWAAERHRLRQRSRRGLCLRCGYDLRSSPDRCPECGSPGPAPAAPPGG